MRAAPCDDAPAVVAAQGVKGIAEDSRPIVAELMERDKRYARLAATLALKGFAMYPLPSGGFLIARHDRTAYAPDYRAVAGFLGAMQ